MKLYEIPVEAEQLEILLTESEGELTPELEKRLSDFVAGGKEKLEQAACVVRSLESQSAACKVEADRLKARSASLEANSDRLKNLMLFALDAGFGGKVKTSFFTIYGQTSSERPEFSVPDIASLPERFVRRKDPELNKQELTQAWKNGETLPSNVTIEVIPGKRSLRIK